MPEDKTPDPHHEDRSTHPSWSTPQWASPAPASWGAPEEVPASAPGAAQSEPAPSGPTPAAQPGGGGPYWQAPAQPGIVPLRPLNLGDLFEATFRAVRTNPTVMFGFSVILLTLLSLLSIVLTWMAGGEKATTMLLDPQAATQLEGLDQTTLIAQAIAEQTFSSLITSVTSGIGGLILSGILAITVSEAVLGRVLGVDEAWRRLRPRLWPLLLTTLLTTVVVIAPVALLVLVAVGIVTLLALDSGVSATLVLVVVAAVILSVVLFIVLNTRLVFAAVVSVLEETGARRAISRSWAITRGVFWRCFGRLFVIYAVVSVLTTVLSAGAGVVSGVLSVVVGNQIAMSFATLAGGILSGLIVPISAAFTTLMYLDERIRRENLAPTLLAAAQQ